MWRRVWPAKQICASRLCVQGARRRIFFGFLVLRTTLDELFNPWDYHYVIRTSYDFQTALDQNPPLKFAISPSLHCKMQLHTNSLFLWRIHIHTQTHKTPNGFIQFMHAFSFLRSLVEYMICILWTSHFFWTEKKRTKQLQFTRKFSSNLRCTFNSFPR